jgi:hypothetical protein
LADQAVSPGAFGAICFVRALMCTIDLDVLYSAPRRQHARSAECRSMAVNDP